MKKVSVIIPVYNSERYLSECVESVLHQDYNAIEIIIADDGSRDNSLNIAHKLAESYSDKIKVMELESGGVSAARNSGIEAASGDYIFFLDSDDSIVPGAIALLSSILDKYDDCDIAVGLMSPEVCTRAIEKKTELVSSRKALEKTLYQVVGNDFSVCGKLYRRSLFEGEVALRFVRGRRYEDLEITPRLYNRARKIAYTDAIVYRYRMNDESFIHTWTQARTDTLWAVDTVLKFVCENCPNLYNAALSRRFSAYYNMFNCAIKYGDRKLSDKCYKEVKWMALTILSDPKTRFKNKLGALVALCGKSIATILANRSF